MKDFKILETEILLDMLAKQTARFINKMPAMNSVESRQVEYEIAMIQGELNSRQTMEMPQSEMQRILKKIRSMLPLRRNFKS